ncbi:hypothetical protein [Catenuloplanes japonicus]|uniref:hypothetical protein n=1 Tax=Catenuloplanes japonicus TaxID=33876 RepID=UPI000A901FD1|nr:hypothetical protein [Catenuloplanes japonicus]
MDQQTMTLSNDVEESGYWAVNEDSWATVCPGLSEEDAAMLAPVVVVGAVPITTGS